MKNSHSICRMCRGGFALLTLCAVAATAQEAATDPTGSISGTTRCEGRVPPMHPIDMNVDPICSGKHGKDDPAMNESIVVDEEGHLANVFVWVVEGVPEGDYPAPETPIVLSQEGCLYHPRVFGIRPGQPLTVSNPDGTIHNVDGMPLVNKGFNLPMDAQTKERTITFEKPEPPFPIKCDVHPWMRAYCAVMDHPFFDVSNGLGHYDIKALPPGTYVVEAWHERYGTQRQEVTVTAGQTAEVSFTFHR